MAIISFKDPDAEKCLNGETTPKAGWCNEALVARRKLIMLVVAEKLSDLKVPPKNKLEALKKERKGQHSIRINDKWRVCFTWKKDGAHDVEITDYH